MREEETKGETKKTKRKSGRGGDERKGDAREAHVERGTRKERRWGGSRKREEGNGREGKNERKGGEKGKMKSEPERGKKKERRI